MRTGLVPALTVVLGLTRIANEPPEEQRPRSTHRLEDAFESPLPNRSI